MDAPVESSVDADPRPVQGVELAAAAAGLKAGDQLDIALVRLGAGSHTAAVFTRNTFTAAPIHVARRHLAHSDARVLLINSGCANAATGEAGERDAKDLCGRAGRACGVSQEAVVPFSTGVIGQRLSELSPMDRIASAIDACAEGLAPGRWPEAARAILTTDTRGKTASREVALSEGVVSVTGMAKGSGMIRPDMATMLGFVATDAAVAPDALGAMLRQAVDQSFHCITVDGDTSTNDAVTLSATGASGVAAETPEDVAALQQAVTAVCVALAQAIVRDAEGATRFVEVVVEGGHDVGECREVAFTVAHSPLIKTALFGGDPNWGRILAAVGRAPIGELDGTGVDIDLGDMPVVRGGLPVPDFDESRAAEIVSEPTIGIGIRLGRGGARARVWTSDLSYDYVRINADYHT